MRHSIEILLHVCNSTHYIYTRPRRSEMAICWRTALTLVALGGRRTDIFDFCLPFQHVRGEVSSWELTSFGHLLWEYQQDFRLHGLELYNFQMILPPYHRWGSK